MFFAEDSLGLGGVHNNFIARMWSCPSNTVCVIVMAVPKLDVRLDFGETAFDLLP